MRNPDFEEKILRDNKSGSSEILSLVLDYNLKLSGEKEQNTDSLELLIKFNNSVINKFSPMAIVVHGLKRVNHIISNSISKNGQNIKICSEIKCLIKDIESMDKKIIKNCSILFPKTKRKLKIATYSNSGLIKKVVQSYRNKIEKIYLSEARPANEGRALAKYFDDIGIEVVFSVDILFAGLLSKVELLLLGADSVGPERFVNKIGSSILLENARKNGVNSAILFESFKIDKFISNENSKKNYRSSEIWPKGCPKSVTVINRYFEMIDNRLADKFISDIGIDTPEALNKRIKNTINCE